MAKPSTSPADHPANATTLKRIFASCDRLLHKAPWNYLFDGQVFGIRLEEEGDVYWVNVLGGGGEVFAINFYRGAPGLAGLYLLMDHTMTREGGYSFDPKEVLMRQCMFQVEFVTKPELNAWDRKALKKAGRSLPTRRGARVAQLQTFVPGYIPWRPEQDECEEIASLLEAVSPIFEILEDDPELSPEPPWSRVPVWTLEGDEDLKARWEAVPEIEDSEGKAVSLPEFVAESAAKFRELPLVEGHHWQLMANVGPSGIEEKGKRPYYPYVTLLCAEDNGAVLGMELCQYDSLREFVMQTVIKTMNSMQMRPSSITVSDQRYAEALSDALQVIDVPVFQGDCPACEEAFSSLAKFKG